MRWPPWWCRGDRLNPATVATDHHTRLTPLGWTTLVEGTLLCLIPAWQIAPVAMAGGIGFLAAVGVARFLAPRRLHPVSGGWILPPRIYAGSEAVLQARLSADPGAPPLTLLAWDPRSRAERPVTRLAGLSRLGASPRWTTRFPARGLVHLPPLMVVGEQPMGLVAATRTVGSGVTVVVLPALGRVRAGMRVRLSEWFAGVATATEMGGDDLGRLRAWMPGDPPARVHWRASARHRELLVAERHAPAARRLSIAIDPNAPPLVFERLVAAAATLIDDLARRGWDLAIYHGRAVTGVHAAADRLLEALALVHSGGAPLDELVPRDAPCLVLLADQSAAPSAGRALVVRDRELPRLIHLPRRLARGDA